MDAKFKNALLALRKARLTRGYTQAEAAEIMGYPDAGELSRWERGAKFPKLIGALKLSATYNSSVDILFHDLSSDIRKDVARRREIVEGRKESAELLRRYGPPLRRSAVNTTNQSPPEPEQLCPKS